MGVLALADDFPRAFVAFRLPKVLKIDRLELAGDQGRQRLWNHDRDGFVGVFLLQFCQLLRDARLRFIDCLAAWWAKRARIVLHLFVQLRLLTFDFLDALALPKPMIEVLKTLADFPAAPGRFSDFSRGSLSGFAWATVNNRDRQMRYFTRHSADLLESSSRKGDIQAPFHTILFIERGRTWTNDHNFTHTNPNSEIE